MDKKDIIYSVIISDRATEMLSSHIRFLAHVSVKAATDLRKEILSVANSLMKFPERFGYIDDTALIQNKYRKAIVARRYLLIYQIKNNNVYIDFIVDCRQGYDWLI